MGPDGHSAVSLQLHDGVESEQSSKGKPAQWHTGLSLAHLDHDGVCPCKAPHEWADLGCNAAPGMRSNCALLMHDAARAVCSHIRSPIGSKPGVDLCLCVLAACPVLQMPVPNTLFAPLMNFAGFNGNSPSSIPAYRWYNEGTSSAVFPRDLYSAQLSARVGTIPAVNTGAGQVTYQSPGYGCNGWTKCLIGNSNATMAKCPTPYTCEWC